MAMCLKSKSGVECIDVNDFLMEMFVSVGYDSILEEAETKELPKINFKRVSKDITDIQDLVSALKNKVADAEYPSDENLEDQPEEPEEDAPEPAPAPEEELPTEEPAEGEEEETPAPEMKDKDDEINDMAELENMVADIASELGLSDKEDTDKKGE